MQGVPALVGLEGHWKVLSLFILCVSLTYFCLQLVKTNIHIAFSPSVIKNNNLFRRKKMSMNNSSPSLRSQAEGASIKAKGIQSLCSANNAPLLCGSLLLAAVVLRR